MKNTVAFADHHPYSESDASRLVAEADAGGHRLVTTEKDFARLAGKGAALAKLRERTETFPVVLEFENPNAVGEMISTALRKAAARTV